MDFYLFSWQPYKRRYCIYSEVVSGTQDPSGVKVFCTNKVSRTPQRIWFVSVVMIFHDSGRKDFPNFRAELLSQQVRNNLVLGLKWIGLFRNLTTLTGDDRLLCCRCLEFYWAKGTALKDATIKPRTLMENQSWMALGLQSQTVGAES